MTTASAERVQLPLEALPKIFPALRSSVPANAADPGIEVECVACRIRITGPELQQLAEGKNLPEKLDRLRLGYCARRSCDSRFYFVTLSSAPASACDAILSLTSQIPSGPERAPLVPVTPAVLLRGTALAMTAFILLFFLHHWYYGGRIPVFQKPHPYRTDGPTLVR